MKKRKDWKYYLTSAGITFIAGFSAGILPLLDNVNAENFSKTILFGIILAGVRTGLSLVARRVVDWYNK